MSKSIKARLVILGVICLCVLGLSITAKCQDDACSNYEEMATAPSSEKSREIAINASSNTNEYYNDSFSKAAGIGTAEQEAQWEQQNIKRLQELSDKKERNKHRDNLKAFKEANPINPFINISTLESSDEAYIANGNFSVALQEEQNKCQSCAVINSYRWIGSDYFMKDLSPICNTSKYIYNQVRQYDDKVFGLDIYDESIKDYKDIGGTFFAVDRVLKDLHLPHYLLETNEANNKKEMLDGLAETITPDLVYIVGVDANKFYKTSDSGVANHAIVLADYNSVDRTFVIVDSNYEYIYEVTYDELFDAINYGSDYAILQIFNN